MQWTKATPADWEPLDLDTSTARRRTWERLPKKAEPSGGETIDDSPGWVYALNCQGMVFNSNDHYAAEPLADGSVRVTVWNDDLLDHPIGQRIAHVWTFHPVGSHPVYPDTWQELTIYAEPLKRAMLPPAIELGPGDATRYPPNRAVFRDWLEFQKPAASVTRHGISVPDDLHSQHVAMRSSRGWQEWR